MEDDECTGTGRCHGCLKWCENCGDVAHVCDVRLRGEACAEHPVPPDVVRIRESRKDAEARLAYGCRLVREAEVDMQDVVDAEHARRAYDRQVAAQERADFLL